MTWRHGLVYVVLVTTMSLVVWPVLWPAGRDSFPLSSYPMFSRARKDAKIHIDYAIALDERGKRSYLSPELVGNSEVLQARATLAHAVRSPIRAVKLCKAIAARVAEAEEYQGAREIRLVSGQHDSVALLIDPSHEGRERVRAKCAVP